MADEAPDAQSDSRRLSIRRTLKLFIGGAFPRSESGHTLAVPGPGGAAALAYCCRGSRKDLRDAIVAARAAQPGWASRSAYNRGQILYRIAELGEARRAQWEAELVALGDSESGAAEEVDQTLDLWVQYAGWCDKFTQVLSCVNPVSTPHFVFSMPEPVGVVAAFAPSHPRLLGLVALLGPVLASGSSCVVLVPPTAALTATTLAEVVHASDVPAGVVNLISCEPSELLPVAADHLDIDAIALPPDSADGETIALTRGAENLKRVHTLEPLDGIADPYRIGTFCEIKTTWHPVEQIGPGGAGY